MAECLPMLGARSLGSRAADGLPARVVRRIAAARSVPAGGASDAPRPVRVTRRPRVGQAEQALLRLALGRYIRPASAVWGPPWGVPAPAVVDVTV